MCCNNLTVYFDFDISTAQITGKDGVSISQGISVFDFVLANEGYGINRDFNLVPYLTYNMTVPEKKTIEVNNSGIWILSTVFHTHPIHRPK